MEFFKDAVKLQAAWHNLLNNQVLSMRAIRETVCPFRDKYDLSDNEALRIARNEMPLSEIVKLAERAERKSIQLQQHHTPRLRSCLIFSQNRNTY